MFIGCYELDGETYFDIYYKNSLGYDLWHKNTFSPKCKDIEILDFKIGGKNYQVIGKSRHSFTLSDEYNCLFIKNEIKIISHNTFSLSDQIHVLGRKAREDRLF